ncbi:MAG TPA: zinc-ribbon domain-containing protein [Polyangiaceae bacterium]
MNQPELSRTLRWVLPLCAALASVVVGVLMGIELGILVLAGAVLVGVIFILWNSVQGLTGEAELTLEEALSLAAPSAEEEEKRSVLRTLKDLEYEKSVGKISDEDYAELVAKYTARAKELIQAVDADMGDARSQVERLLAKRMGEAAEPAKESKPHKVKREKRASDGEKSAPLEKDTECPECNTANDPDARFCKSCGTPLEAAS